jgi:hypothetical protein
VVVRPIRYNDATKGMQVEGMECLEKTSGIDAVVVTAETQSTNWLS